MSKIITDLKTGNIGYYHKGVWHAIYIDEKKKIWRDRIECLIIDNDQVFLEFRPDGNYKVPGGSKEIGATDQEQVINECKEEARINVENVKYSGVTYTEIRRSSPEMTKEHGMEYEGYRSTIYVANFLSKFRGYIPEELQEKSMVKNGKFYDIDKVFFKLKPAHRDAIKEFREDLVTEGKLSQEDRDKLKPSDFGIPELRKYPLIDKSHVLMAIRYFDKAPEEYKEELAHNIYSKSKKFKMNINKDSKWYSYIEENAISEYDSLSEMVLSEGYLNFIRHIRDYLDSYIVEVDCTKMSMSEIESLTEDTRLSGYKPVYIVLTDTGSLMSRMIKKVTGSAFNHSSIAFDESLNQLYSFGLGDTGSVPMFSIESKDNTYLKRYKKVPSQVYAVFVTNEQYTAMKYKVNEFVKNKKKYRYNWVGLLGYTLNKPIEIPNKMFCSEFVDNMFKFVDVDLTGKAPGLVEPFDFAKSKSKQIYKVFDDSLDKYKPEEIRKRTKFALSEYLKSFELAKVVGESTILNETKHFPVQFDKEGNLIIKNLRKLDFEQEYQQSHKLLLVYSKNKNYEGMKYELSKLWFLNNVLEQEIYNNESPDRKNKIKLRARILNDFNKYLKEVTSKDTGFNFTEYYNNTPFSDNEIVVSKNTVRGTVQLVKSIFL